MNLFIEELDLIRITYNFDELNQPDIFAHCDAFDLVHYKGRVCNYSYLRLLKH